MLATAVLACMPLMPFHLAETAAVPAAGEVRVGGAVGAMGGAGDAAIVSAWPLSRTAELYGGARLGAMAAVFTSTDADFPPEVMGLLPIGLALAVSPRVRLFGELGVGGVWADGVLAYHGAYVLLAGEVRFPPAARP